MYIKLGKWIPKKRGNKQIDTAKKISIVAIMVIIFFAVTSYGQTLRIYHIDVEQGDATLIVMPNGVTMLIDSGPNGKADEILAVMNTAGVTEIDVYVCTHYHSDHYGSIDDLVNNGVPVRVSYDRGEKDRLTDSKKNSPAYMAYDTTVGENAISLVRGDTIPYDSAIQVLCIAANTHVIGEEFPTDSDDENDNSVCLLISYGEFKYFIGGDVTEATEDDIANQDQINMKVNVYQANHHGSETSSSRPFMDTLCASVIIISNGNHCGYNHPRQSTLDLYDSLPNPPVVFQTNKNLCGSPAGNVSDDRIGDPETSDPDGTILVEVDNASSIFSVSLKSTVYDTYPIRECTTSISHIFYSLVPMDYNLCQNYPNPFNPETQIEFTLPRASYVRIYINNIIGERIRTLVNQRLSAGHRSVGWRGDNDFGKPVPSGIYFYTIEAEQFTKTMKMVLLK